MRRIRSIVTPLMLSAALVGMVVGTGPAAAATKPHGSALSTSEALRAVDAVPATGVLQGRIQTTDGRPLAGGKAYFFNDRTGPPPAPENYWRVPDAVAALDGNGAFSLELSVGQYYIGAIQRKSDASIIGPPSVGDLFYSNTAKYEVAAATTTAVGPLRGAEPFSTARVVPDGKISAINGVVVGAGGKPLSNAIVFAYIIPAMNGRPLFVSERTGPDGRYHLRVPGNRTYYLRVRDVYGGGMPVTGALMGVYGGDTPTGVTVKQGETVQHIQISAELFARPTKKSR